MNLVQELLQEFCHNWQGYNVLKYEGYLQRTSNTSERIELLALMMQKEIQFVFEPPAHVMQSSDHEDDDCVRPNLRLLLAHFQELNDHPKKILDLILFEFAMCLRFDDLPPTPENYLDLVPQDHRSHLCETLERIEGILQKPKYEPEVEVSASDLTVKDPLGSANVSLNRLPCILGNHLVLSVIDRGGMGTVYSAVDLRTAAPVAIKVMKRDDAWSIYRFIHEFTWLSQMTHPNLVKLFDSCAEGEYRYFSMEVVEGLTLSKWFQSTRHKPNPYTRLKRVLQQVASALQFLHRSGGLHCDIKCSNVMITSKRRAVLLDLGLAIQEHSDEKGLGTVQYSAPEVIKTEVHSRASDWFSFGLMIYEAIVGEYNLRTEQAKSGSRDPELYVIDSKDLYSQLEGADPDLIDLCSDLVQTDPAARPSGTEVVERLGGSPDPVLTYGSFIGRRDLLRRLDTIEQTDAAQLVILGGESGIGKTSLIQEWLRRRSRSDNDLILKLRCFRQDQTPLRVLNGLIQDLMQVLPKIPESIWLPSLMVHIDSISRTFPQIRQLIESSNDFKSRHPSSKTHSVENENLSTLHLMHWIVQLGQQLRFLLVIDDAQWSDPRSLAWIVELFQQRGFSGKALILDESLPAGDSEDFGQVLQTISEHIFVSNTSPAEVLSVPGLSIELLHVEPLNSEESTLLLQELCSSIQHEISTPVMENICQRSEGNPFLLQELMQTYVHYLQRGSITEEIWLSENPDSSSIRSRVSLLPRKVENILHYLAVADQPLSFQQLKTASRMRTKELQSAINVLESLGWIDARVIDGVSTIELSHERFRKAILSSLPEDRLQRRHFHVAKMLSGNIPPPWARIGQHYWAAKQYREAAACYVQAAQTAAVNADYQSALDFLERASHSDATRSEEELRQIQILKADCLGAVGNAIQSAAIYLELTESTTSDQEIVLFRTKAGEQLIRGGRLEDAVKHLGEVFREIRVGGLKRGLWPVTLIRLHILKDVLSRPNSIDLAREEIPLDKIYKVLNRLAVPLTILDSQFGTDMIVRMKRRTEKTGSVTDRAIAVIHFGTLLTLTGGLGLRKGMRWLRHGHELAKRSNSSTASALFHFCLLLIDAQYGKLGRVARRAALVQHWMDREPRSMNWESQFVAWCMSAYYWYTMRLSEGYNYAQEARKSADERSDSMTQFLMRSGTAFLVDLARDDEKAAERSLVFQANNFATQQYQSPWFYCWINRIQFALYRRKSNDALDLLNAEWSRLAQSYVFQGQHYRFIVLCLRLCAEMQSLVGSDSQFESSLTRCMKFAKQLSNLESNAYALYGRGFTLVLKTYRGEVAPPQQWHAIIGSLESKQHSLFANALRWHHEIETGEEKRVARQKLVDAGCVQPEKLMNLMIPLPEDHS